MTHADQVQPSRVRYLVVALAMMASLLLYLDRYCISFAERYIKQDLGLSNFEISVVLGAFFLSYALGQVPSGFLADRHGARLMLTLYILIWSFFTGLTGLAGGFVMLVLFRLGVGIGQAGAYPTCGGLISKWVPFAARGQASSLIAFGGRIGGSFAPLLTALFIVWFVPVSVSSLLQPADLLDLPTLCKQLNERKRPVDDYLLDGLPSDLRAQVPVCAARTDTACEPALAQGMLTRLNQVVRDRSFYRDEFFGNFDLPREAVQLAGRPREQLSDDEVHRLNRLALEAAYPDALRKVYVAGWRPVMMVFGALGLLVAALFWLLARDRPRDHPSCNEEEVRLIEESLPGSGGDVPTRVRCVPLGHLVRSRTMWLMCITHAGTNMGWVFLVGWLPRYLDEVHHLPIGERGTLATIPLVVGWAGMILGGYSTDRLTRRVGRRWGRALPIALSRFVAMAAYLTCLLNPDPMLATVAFALVAFGTDFGSPAIWAFSLDVGGRYAASFYGWPNMWGNLAAGLSLLLLNWIVDTTTAPRWDLAFLMCAVAFAISGLAALGIDASKSIAPEDD
ncbi:MAG: MFS transporter [Gemmataceae bacterium]